MRRSRATVKSFQQSVEYSQRDIRRILAKGREDWKRHHAVIAATGAVLKRSLQAAAVTAAYALYRLAKDQLRYIHSLSLTADKLGITADALSRFHYAAKLAGMSAETFNMGLQFMMRGASEAAIGTGRAQKAIKELGLDAARLTAMGPERAMLAVAEAMRNVDTESDRIRLAYKLFGEEGVGMVSLVKGGNTQLQQQMDQAAGVSEEQVRGVRRTADIASSAWEEAKGDMRWVLDKGGAAISWAMGAQYNEPTQTLKDLIAKNRARIEEATIDRLNKEKNLLDFNERANKKQEARLKYEETMQGSILNMLKQHRIEVENYGKTQDQINIALAQRAVTEGAITQYTADRLKNTIAERQQLDAMVREKERTVRERERMAEQDQRFRAQLQSEREGAAGRAQSFREQIMTPKQRMDRDIREAQSLVKFGRSGLSGQEFLAFKALRQKQFAEETKVPAVVPDAPLAMTAPTHLAAYESRFMAGGGGQNYDRDQLVVLKRIEQAVAETARKDRPNVAGLN